MKNYVKPNTTELIFVFDSSKQRYSAQLSVTNLLKDKQILTKVHSNSYANFLINPGVVYINPGETKSIRIERLTEPVSRKKDKFMTYSIQLNTPVSSYEEAKNAFKAVDYRKEGQQIQYSTQFLPQTDLTFNSMDVTKDTKKECFDDKKKEIEEAQKKIAQLERVIQALEHKLKANCQRDKELSNEGLMRSKHKNERGRKGISLETLIGLFLLSLILGATLNKWN